MKHIRCICNVQQGIQCLENWSTKVTESLLVQLEVKLLKGQGYRFGRDYSAIFVI